jgi:Exportin-5 family
MGILSWRNLIDDAIRPLVINCPQDQWTTFLPALLPPLLTWLVQHVEWDALKQISSEKSEDARDEGSEVSKEAVLRLLFESMVGLCTDLVSPMTRGDTAIVVNSKEMAFAGKEVDSRHAVLQKKLKLREFVLERQVQSYAIYTDNRTLWRRI